MRFSQPPTRLIADLFMRSLFNFIVRNPKSVIAVILLIAGLGCVFWQRLAVDVFPDISVPRVTIQTEAGALTAEEVEQLVTIPIEAAVNGIPGVTTVRSSSSGGLSFVWVDFDWNEPLSRARFNVFERLSRVQAILPEEAETEIAPEVSVTGEIMLVALTAKPGGPSPFELREMAEYDLRTRLLAIPGIGEVVVIGGQLPEYRVTADPTVLATFGLTFSDVIAAASDSRTYLSAGYLPHVAGEEIPLRQLARADTLAAIKAAAVPTAEGVGVRLGDVADISLAGMPRRGSASFNGKDAVILSIQKAPGGNTLALTDQIDAALTAFAAETKQHIDVHPDAYRQKDFIAASVHGGSLVLRDAVIVVIGVLLITLLELRTILIVLLTMPLSILAGLTLFPLFGLGVNVMTLGGFAVAAGDIVDAAIIFTEAIRRKLGENAALDESIRRPVSQVIVEAACSVAPGVLFSTFIVMLVFTPLLLLSGLEGRFFRPLALSYLCVFAMSLVCAWCVVPALAKLFRIGVRPKQTKKAAQSTSLGVRVLRGLYRPFLSLTLRLPKTMLLLSLIGTGFAIYTAMSFGTSFLPPFREDAFNVMVSLPPGASLEETERLSEACVPALTTPAIPGILSIARRTGRAERDQHAEPVSSSEFVVRVDLASDTGAIRDEIRARLSALPGCAVVVGYPIAHRISAVLSGTEAELAVNVYGEDIATLREVVAKMKQQMEQLPEIADVRANREITVRTLRIDYDTEALLEAGLTLREAGEQVAAAFNGLVVGEVRNGIRRRSVTVRLAADSLSDPEAVKALILSSSTGKFVRLDQVAQVVPEDASNLMLREGGRRKALISCNPAPNIDTGKVVERLRETLSPIAAEAGCTLSFGGSYQARESAANRLTLLGIGLLVAIGFILVVALGSAKAALIALINVPLSLMGAVLAVWLAEPVLSVSSLVGFVTVIGFVLRNGILLINSYHERLNNGESLETAIRLGSEERMVPIVMTSLTTVIGLIPIMLAGDKPGGELLAPLAIVQFGGLLGAMCLNLLILPAAVRIFGLEAKGIK